MTIMPPHADDAQTQQLVSPAWVDTIGAWDVDAVDGTAQRTLTATFGTDISPVHLEAVQVLDAAGTCTTSPVDVVLPNGSALQLEEAADVATALLAAVAAVAGTPAGHVPERAE